MFLNLIVYPQTKLRGTKTGLICSGSSHTLFNEPWTLTQKNKQGKGKPTAAREYSYSVLRNYFKSTTLNSQKGKIEMNLSYLEAWEIQPGIHI
jgi:hypothetical protein